MTVRSALLLVHRWGGLAIAGFLIMAGATGAVISWDHELDDLLNARLTRAPAGSTRLSAFDLAQKVESADRRVRVTYLPLDPEPGESLRISVEPRVDPATDQPYEPGYNEVFVDPATGKELGRREWGKAALTRENFVPFLDQLHYSLHVPEIAGNSRLGIWLMGAVAIVWALDCFVGFYLTLPRRAKAATPQRGGPAVRSSDATDGGIVPASPWWRRWSRHGG